MEDEQEKSLEKIKKQILLEKGRKNIGIPVFISDLKNVLTLMEEKDKQIDKQIDKYQNMLVTNDLLHIKENQEKDKIIDLMSEKIFEEGIVWENKEEVKQYFENKAKEILNK